MQAENEGVMTWHAGEATAQQWMMCPLLRVVVIRVHGPLPRSQHRPPRTSPTHCPLH